MLALFCMLITIHCILFTSPPTVLNTQPRLHLFTFTTT